jgi:TfoX/Sxy family transcriptional regulator of competence genes
MAWKTSPPGPLRRFDEVVPAFRGATRRKMFGYPAAFVNGNMFAGLHEDRFVLRLGEEHVAAAKRAGARDFEPMAGRTMKGWCIVPPKVLADDATIREWVARAYRHAAKMAPKATQHGARPAVRRANKQERRPGRNG